MSSRGRSVLRRIAARATAVVLGIVMAVTSGLVTTGLVTTGLVTTGLIAAPAAHASPSAAGVLRWAPCGGPARPGAECATLPVPVDWARPDGPGLGLAVARRKATGPGTRVGSMVFGPGGPGDSGVETVVRRIGRFSPEVRSRFDIVSFDPRGVGGSSPVICSGDLLAERPSPELRSQADFDATVAYNRRLRADCRARTGPVFDHLDTARTVRDLEALRAALGERKLTFHGSSYGTLLGAQYAETYPRRVRAMVLESVMDHSVPTTRDFLRSQAAAADDSFQEFVSWCDGAAECALRDRDVREVWRGLLTRAGRGELEDPTKPGIALSSADLVNKIAFRSFYRADHAGLATVIAKMDTSEPLPASPTRVAPLPPATPVFCSDWRLPVRDHREYASLVALMHTTAPDLPHLLPIQMVAACLGTPTANPQHRLDARGVPPVLVSNALHDPATGHPWAVSVARQLGRSGVLLTYEGHGHGSVTRGPCMEDTVDSYLIDLTVPPRGMSCPAIPV
ncbi:alpha/beta hydrolase [Streptomyces clavuligerus]|uniref:Putative hydrolase n=1 Tax=Streptomyces clavuligerus TaxID=1901 RepID=B5GTL0_STRCL|nr:alpha/beta hydrolase [Streptomyces clavuligerus]EDY49656.1 proteinase [Streptomyces clavuligerus]EFG04078.1 putative hydrolase [Streptomyces clavuligerus]MBY6307435.1 alpha/beta fold hydrolase [Streptomyces clavuligerus]QCS10006.1 alpha/beta hydrolase [Streptomyces clavuligerus]QPJ97950.1 alpha/beta fold hydrolase [Streptomyces clavuligerus]